jgi:hypothetical protein
MVLMGSGRPARSAALARNVRRTWRVSPSACRLVHIFTWPGGKPNTDVKSAPYHLSKSNQQRQQHECTRAEQGVRHRRLVIMTGLVQNVVEDRGERSGADCRPDSLHGLQRAAGGTGHSHRHVLRVSVTFGEVTMPPPSPATSSGPIMTHCADSAVVCRSSMAVVSSPTTIAVSPHRVSERPNRGTSRPAMTAEAATPIANGVTDRPERNGEYPKPSCKYSASTSQTPVNPMKVDESNDGPCDVAGSVSQPRVEQRLPPTPGCARLPPGEQGK